MEEITENNKKNFWKNVKESDVNFCEGTPCWEWQAYTRDDGYARMGIGKSCKKELCHRVSWVLHNGEINDGLLVCHKCDNPKCVNPKHLFLGTHLDNALDKISKGRDNPAIGDRNITRKHPEKFQGEKNGGAKLTQQKVDEIRKIHALRKYKQKELAAMFQMSVIQIDRIVNFRSWKNQ